MKIKVIISSKFNIMSGERNITYNKNSHEKETLDWIKNRIYIFINFTLKSLSNQTNQNFTAVYVYEDSTEPLIFQELNQYGKLPDNILFVKKSDYSNVINVLSFGYDMLYYVRLDSDDMYSKDYVEKLLTYPLNENTQILLSQYGYIYDSQNNRMAEYYHKQFTYYTFIYRLYKETLTTPSFNLSPWDLLVNFSHGRVIDYSYEVLSGRNFLFNIHGENTNSTFGIYNWGFARVERLITSPNELDIILKTFF